MAKRPTVDQCARESADRPAPAVVIRVTDYSLAAPSDHAQIATASWRCKAATFDSPIAPMNDYAVYGIGGDSLEFT